jgi:hypothetical protein
MMKARCGHSVEEDFAEAHSGLCRRCHSNFTFISELESKYGEDALVQYWYGMILARLSSVEESGQGVNCLIDHLVEFYQKKLAVVPSRRKYIRKMLFMLDSLRHPVELDAFK